MTAGGRNGGFTSDKAYNGANTQKYFNTPSEFYKGAGSGGTDPADTTGGDVGVLDPNGIVRSCRASGFYIHLPEIDGIGSVRIRYPIAPVTVEGDTVYKEVQALFIASKRIKYPFLFICSSMYLCITYTLYLYYH